ncbi:MAG TPA: S8 family serine peptidase, partial [Gemmatimonadales bacterium]|nr:S8 family serine peptidase [Gemmatimonadales bacterium]
PLVGPQLAAQQGEPRDSALPAADTYLRQGNPNQNQGTESVLKLQASGKNRGLLWWDPVTIRGAVGADSLVSARLELTIALNADNWGLTGRTIDLHRLTQAWRELGATWNCAVDTDPTNPVADCSGETAWAMDGPNPRPWVTVPTATQLIATGLTGVVTLNVTADVADPLLGSGVLHGWILKKTDEGASGRVDFGSRESVSPPRLVLTSVQQAQDTSRPPIPDSFTYPADTTLWVAPPPNVPSDTLVRYYRTVIGIRFDDTTSGITVRRVLQRYGATIIGGLPRAREYIVRVPDPGPTFDALARLIGAISNEPGVKYAAGVTFRNFVKPYGRYPSDGIGGQRRDWLGAATDATRAWRQIRAPLAWGCETGAYDQGRVKVGVIDFLFDTSRDFDGASVTLTQPGATDVTTDPQLRDPVNRSHGTAVAGTLAATGDNGIGGAGMLWRSELQLFALSRGDSLTVRDPSVYLAEEVFPEARDRGVRVLVVSVTQGGTDSLALSRLQAAITEYVDAGRGNLFVFAAGNENSREPLARFQQAHATHLGLMVATARLFGTRADHILIVGGTDATGALWKTDERHASNFWFGATEIAAPATAIRMLVRASGDFPEGALVSGGGTSLSAPLVGGVAGLLLAMDSTLTAAQVKDYILRGGREAKGWSAPGVPILATPVAGAPEAVYQLDAYGALTLLARERRNTPICGFPVGLSLDGSEVVLHRNVDQRLAISGVSAISVAQGGRRLALLQGSTVLETDHHGGILRTITGVDRRWYLETDTADVVSDGQRRATVILRGAGRVDTIPISARVPIPSTWGVESPVTVVPSPDGAWFAAYHELRDTVPPPPPPPGE